MRIVKLLSIALFAGLFVVACGGGASNTNQTANTTNTANTANTSAAKATPTPDAITSAKAIYAAECARCHGIGGEGGTPTVLGKKIKVPSLKKGHALSHTDEQLAKIVSEGEEAMPAFKDKLKPEEITSLVKMIRQEFQAGAAKK
ncbi:MAG TPA: cytochrome c [Pyrinomonadaceae bacterium]|nr:cytochrome c [Pyrinomonadaceae bacterium]